MPAVRSSVVNLEPRPLHPLARPTARGSSAVWNVAGGAARSSPSAYPGWVTKTDACRRDIHSATCEGRTACPPPRWAPAMPDGLGRVVGEPVRQVAAVGERGEHARPGAWRPSPPSSARRPGPRTPGRASCSPTTGPPPSGRCRWTGLNSSARTRSAASSPRSSFSRMTRRISERWNHRFRLCSSGRNRAWNGRAGSPSARNCSREVRGSFCRSLSLRMSRGLDPRPFEDLPVEGAERVEVPRKEVAKQGLLQPYLVSCGEPVPGPRHASSLPFGAPSGGASNKAGPPARPGESYGGACARSTFGRPPGD